jgi:hypothetical protein
MSNRTIFFDKYQKQILNHKPAKINTEIVKKMEHENEDITDDEIEQELKTLKIEINVPENGIGGGPRFLVQYDTQNHLFLDENEKVKSNLSNTLRALLRIDHSIGKDFKYFHIESLVKSFLPLQLVSNDQIKEKNKKQLEKMKKEYNKHHKSKSILDQIWEEDDEEQDQSSNNHELGQTRANYRNRQDNNHNPQVLRGHRSNLSVGRQNLSLNSSLRSDKILADSFRIERRRKASRGLKNDHLSLGYKGGSKQYVSAQKF